MKTVEEIVDAIPPEDNLRLRKMAAARNTSVADLVVILLREGVSTYGVMLASFAASSSLFSGKGC